jgi:hypothetical protein
VDKPIDKELRRLVEALLNSSNRVMLTGMKEVAKAIQLDIVFFFKKESTFLNGVAALDATDPDLANYCRKARIWADMLNTLRNEMEHNFWSVPKVQYRIERGSVEVLEPEVMGRPVSDLVKLITDRMLCFVEDNAILHETSSAERWHKSKEKIEREVWQKALQWMKDKGLVPVGYGKHTRHTAEQAGRSRMNLHKEISFETEVCEHLAAHGWLYAEGDAASYDRELALFPADVLAWVQQAQPKAWELLTRAHGAKTGVMLLARLREQLNARGTLDVLRHGVEMIGLKQNLVLAQFKPALAMNPDILARYAANKLRVVRQVRYSVHNENCLDLVLFLNGIPVATVELKTDFTQRVEDAVDQYRFDIEAERPIGRAGAGCEPIADPIQECPSSMADCPGPEGREGCRRGQRRDGQPHSVQAGYGFVPARLHLSVTDIRLPEHGNRGTVHLLPPLAAAAGLWPRARRD